MCFLHVKYANFIPIQNNPKHKNKGGLNENWKIL